MRNNRGHNIKQDIAGILQFENAKKYLTCHLVNYAYNQEWLQDKPFRRMEDLAVFYVLELENGRDESTYMTITNALLSKYHISEEQLHDAALANMERLSRSHFADLRDIMMTLMTRDIAESFEIDEAQARTITENQIPEKEIYCLTNDTGQYGAAELLRPKIQEMAARMAGGSYYVIPCSIHEVLIVPQNEVESYQELEQMVREVNETQVQLQERLSDFVYAYDANQKCLYRADQKEAEKTKSAAGEQRNVRRR